MRLTDFKFILLGIVMQASACGDKGIDTPPTDIPTEEEEAPTAYHDKIRTQPYPKLSNELYLNPSPLIVPQSAKTEQFLQFELSNDETFPTESTLLSDTVTWCMYNPHQTLSTGRWYWRYRNVTATGQKGEWSETIPFEVKADASAFVTPAFDVFKQNLPTHHPRLFCFVDPDLEQARKTVTSHSEYRKLIGRAQSAMLDASEYQSLISPYKEANMSKVEQYADFLYQAYLLTNEDKYADKLREVLHLMATSQLTDGEVFSSNFGSSYIAGALMIPYDALYDKLTNEERTAVERKLGQIAAYYFDAYRGKQENHIFDNHFWQRNMRTLFQISLLLYDKVTYTALANESLEYYYELWTARAPAGGFNRDGAWINGMTYFNANVKTLFYMPLMFSYITGQNFLSHPWYQHAGQALTYNWLPNSKSIGFGDNSEKYDAPTRQRLAFADFLAREVQDPYAGWYAGTCSSEVQDDFEMRLYRMTTRKTYTTQLPTDSPKLKWYEDIGQVVMHSHLTETDKNLTVSFRSSTFGSGSHTLADQNSFNLLYKGKAAYYHSGYYLNFSDAHNLMSYRHTRAHNSILINGIGQPFSTEGYGTVLRAGSGTNIGYSLGDASHAYCGISNDPMWIEAFSKAGLAQTPQYGFGTTPLTKYRRQMVMLYPDNMVLIYDELEASTAADWSWLLHSPVRFGINENPLSFTTEMNGGTGTAVACLFTDASCTASQTDQFAVQPTATANDPAYPNQWHLTVSIPNSRSVKLLTLIQVKDNAASIVTPTRDGNTIRCGRWQIRANLSAEGEAALSVRDTQTQAKYSYDARSSVLYDEINGSMRTIEETDKQQISTRTIR